ncbi:hypothetical protein ATCV1_z228L [Acanthocystis turfacea chlorella virus 1]|uniref:Uncharacterized protein z228L n=1 Tax=Chlorovirus heliozoae TaxID=322019 RepID=A7K8I8_9PHYC|nr:hypothetical protein ATCV1_z228L [Acanthocystis turfacea chlorella virus 1]ABT16362.1 hypothetical protein ATCV1_z228L [Acanthocystis turfacea chlorella virus 1]
MRDDMYFHSTRLSHIDTPEYKTKASGSPSSLLLNLYSYRNTQTNKETPCSNSLKHSVKHSRKQECPFTLLRPSMPLSSALAPLRRTRWVASSSPLPTPAVPRHASPFKLLRCTFPLVSLPTASAPIWSPRATPRT